MIDLKRDTLLIPRTSQRLGDWSPSLDDAQLDWLRNRKTGNSLVLSERVWFEYQSNDSG